MDRPAGDAEDAVDELTALVLDTLGPVFAMYRREVARRAGLGPDELVCLDQLRRLGPAPASAVGEWVGVTRSVLSKLLRRLETAGHVVRGVPGRRGQEVEVAWRPEAHRDAVLEDLRRRVRRDMTDLVDARRLADPDRRALVAWWGVQVADMLARHTRLLRNDVAHERFLARRRREHAEMPDFRWWEQ